MFHQLISPHICGHFSTNPFLWTSSCSMHFLLCSLKGQEKWGKIQSIDARLRAGLNKSFLFLLKPNFLHIPMLCDVCWLKLSPTIFIYRLMEVLRKLVGTIKLFPLFYQPQKFQPFLPLLEKVVLCLVVIALTFQAYLLKPLFLLILSVLQQVVLLILLP